MAQAMHSEMRIFPDCLSNRIILQTSGKICKRGAFPHLRDFPFYTSLEGLFGLKICLAAVPHKDA